MPWRFSSSTSANFSGPLPTLGIAFSDKEVAVAIFPSRESEPITAIAVPLPDGAIGDGVILNESLVVSAITNILSELPPHSKTCIASIPAALTYSTLFRLPQALANPEQIKSATRLLIPNMLPWKTQETVSDFRFHYFADSTDAEGVAAERTVITLLAAPREVVDAYSRVLLSAKLTPVALESDAMSQVRLLDSDPNGYIISLTTGETHAYITAIGESEADFTFAFPLSRVQDYSSLENESERVRLFAQYELGHNIPKSTRTPVYKANITDRLPRGANTPTSYAATGAAFRASKSLTQNFVDPFELPPSLLPLDTLTIMGFEKLIGSLRLTRVIAIALIAIYVTISTITLLALNKATSSIVAQKPEQGIRTEIDNMQSKFDSENSTFTALDSVVKDEQRWTQPLASIDGAFTPGVVPLSMAAENSMGPYQITGVAGTRAQFNQFRHTLPSNPAIHTPRVPLGFADKETDLPFSAVFFVNASTTTPPGP